MGATFDLISNLYGTLYSMGRFSRRLTSVKPRKTIAVTLDRAKTGALAFDHVYGPSEAKIPGGIGPGLSWNPSFKKDPFIRVKVTRPDGSNNPSAMAVATTLPGLQHHLQHRKNELFAALRSEGLSPVEFLDTHGQTYSRGDDPYIFATLNGIVSVDEEQLEWEQVLEFRQDQNALLAYRSLLQWFNNECIDMELREAEHHLCTTYELALEKLQKHGIVTGMGTVATLMVGGSALLAAITSGVGVLGAFAAGLATSVAGYNVTARLTTEYLKRKEQQLVGPVAYLQRYDALARRLNTHNHQ